MKLLYFQLICVEIINSREEEEKKQKQQQHVWLGRNLYDLLLKLNKKQENSKVPLRLNINQFYKYRNK